MGILNNSNAISVDSGYDITDSLRFRASASAYLSRTPSSAGNRKTWTWSAWVKRGTSNDQVYFSAGTGDSNYLNVRFQPDYISVVSEDTSLTLELRTSALYRDHSAWYHIVVAIDTTQSTDSNRAKLYVNGEQITSFSSTTYPSLNYDTLVNNTNEHSIGRSARTTDRRQFDGYLTEVNFVDGQQLAPSDFGETNDNGTWIPKKYTGTYGTNGFYLKGRGTDNSGNSNNFTENNFNTTNSALTTYDIMSDVPTLTDEDTANFPTLNPLSKAGNVALTDGNLTNAWDSSAGTSQAATMATPTTGKWYYEFVTTVSSADPVKGVIGIQKSPNPQSEFPGYGSSDGWSIYLHDGNKFNGSTSGGDSYGSSFAVNDVCMVAVDLDNSKIYWGKNGTWFNSGNPATGANAAYTNVTGPVFFALGDGSGANTFTGHMNFGQRPFAYTPPTGFKKLNTFNLPDSTITDGSEYFDTVLFTGDGSNDRFISTGFSTDFTWLKNRGTTNSHYLSDTVRGNEKALFSNSTAAEFDYSSVGGLSFATGGITVDTGTSNVFNTSGGSFVTWNWRGSDSTAVSNTDGDITSTVSANPTAGFSVVTYTEPSSGTYTVGHGLGVVPSVILTKSRSSADNWVMFHKSISTAPTNKGLYLNSTSAEFATGANWLTENTTTKFGITVGQVTAGGQTRVAYCFAEVDGYSKMGTYAGNGSTDGPFIYTGFKPAVVIIKSADTAKAWQISDSARDPFNLSTKTLFPNGDNAEQDSTIYGAFDMLSNGFKWRTSDNSENGSGTTYIYMAFAENPFKNSNAR